MSEAYSKISLYDRPHVYLFVLAKKISTLESIFKNFRIQPENTLDTCERKPFSSKKGRFHKFPDTCGRCLSKYVSITSRSLIKFLKFSSGSDLTTISSILSKNPRSVDPKKQ